MGTTWLLLGLTLAACASTPSHPPAQPPPEEEPEEAAVEDASSKTPSTITVDTPERSRPPSTASYEQAMARPEVLDVNDVRPHLTDGQLRGPMPVVVTGCRLPSNARVTIRTAVQHGRAIGVTVDVRFEHPMAAKRRSRAVLNAEAKAEAKAAKKIIACVDRAVRAVVWPPSSRRDSFTTEF
jgi:hypothetical protein